MWRRRGRRREPSEPVTIVDLSERHRQSYFVCLEDWSTEMQEAGDHKARWYEQNRDRGLRVKLAVDAEDQAIGMIQYVPIELSPALGDDLYMILCVWVHGHREGVGDMQGHGIGTALLAAAEDDARELGAKGIVAWGLHLPVWMKSAWFKKHGYRPADRNGIADLVWKPFTDDAHEPRWVPDKPVPEGEAGKVTVTAFNSGWCPAANLVYERARRASEEVGTEVHFRTIDTSDRENLLDHGHDGQVFVDGRPLQRGAPPSYRAVRRKIDKRVRRLRRRRS